MKRLSVVLIFLCVNLFKLNAQYASNGLSAGDIFPDYIFKVWDDGKFYDLEYSQIKKKHVILVFWNVRCTGAVMDIKRLDSIQKTENNELQIILVTNNRASEVNDLFTRKIIRKPDIPLVMEDSILYNKIFPHTGDPLHVWISPNGKIQGITSSYNLGKKNLSKFLRNEPLNFVQMEYLPDFSDTTALVSEVLKYKDAFDGAYSFFTRGLHNKVLNHSIREFQNELGNKIGIRTINSSILTLYELAYNTEIYGFDLNMLVLTRNNRLILGSTEAQKLLMPKDLSDLDTWSEKNLVSYEIFLPKKRSNEIYKWMQEDLDRYFGQKVYIKKRLAKSLVLVETNANRNSAKLAMEISIKSRYEGREQMKDLVRRIIYSTQEFGLPFVDETLTNFPKNISIPFKAKSLNELNFILEQNGLKLIVANRKIEFLVVE